MDLKSNRGAILIQVIFILSVTLIIVFMFSQQLAINRKEQIRLRTVINVLMIKNNLMSYLQDLNAIAATVSNSPSMSCLPGHVTQCTAGGPLKVMDSKPGPAASVYYDSTLQTAGFRLDGTACNGFLNTGNDECPIHVDVQWQPICSPSPPCIPTTIKITGDFTLKARSSEIQTSVGNHHFEFIANAPP